jgi:hypothetical protein
MRTLACALLVGWGLAASGCTKPTEVRTAPAVVVGRYVIVHSPQVERDVILLDTATGRTWYQASLTDLTDEPSVWLPEPQLNTDADWSALREAHPVKSTASTTP